jgi:hypothetical protein
MPVDLWSLESRLYAKIDAAGIRQECLKVKERLGETYNVAITVETRDEKPLENSRIVRAKDLTFRVNFWKDGERDPFLRVDTDNKFLHFHLSWNGEVVDDHTPLPEGKLSVSQLISNAFEATRVFLSAKNVEISKGDDFGGFA